MKFTKPIFKDLNYVILPTYYAKVSYKLRSNYHTAKKGNHDYNLTPDKTEYFLQFSTLLKIPRKFIKLWSKHTLNNLDTYLLDKKTLQKSHKNLTKT